MQKARAAGLGVLGAVAISALSFGLRAAGVPIGIETILGTMVGAPLGPSAFFLGLLMHLAIGGAFGLLYGWLFETVWVHGGAGTGMILSVIHAALIGMAVGLTPQFHPLIPEVMPAPGAYFSTFGVVGVLSFFAMHVLFGAIVGGGYGHVVEERQWAPEGRL